MNFCFNCGEKLDAVSAFCPECGAKLEVEQKTVKFNIPQGVKKAQLGKSCEYYKQGYIMTNSTLLSQKLGTSKEQVVSLLKEYVTLLEEQFQYCF